MNAIFKADIQDILANPISWEKLRNKVVMITGASGMVGSYLVHTLLALNEQDYNVKVVGVMRNPKKMDEAVLNNPNFEVYVHDVSLPFNYEGTVDYIIHAASPASPLIMKDKPVETAAANALGTYYSLLLAKEKQASGYMFISSREIYGQPLNNEEFFYEDTYGFVNPLDPRSCYPEGKKFAETLCASFAAEYGLNAKSARLAHTYGPGMSIYDGRVQADFLNNVIHGEDIVLKSEGLPVRTYTYIADAIAGMFYVLLDGEEMAYNIGDENAKISIRGLAELLVELTTDKELKLVVDIPEGGTKGTAPFTAGILNSGKLRGLGWAPKQTLETGFKRMIDYLKLEMEAGNIK